MIKKIKEYLELNKLYRQSKKILVINLASATMSFKDIIEKIEKIIDSSEAVSSISKEDINTMTEFMSKMIKDKSLQKAVVHEVVNKIDTRKK